MAGRIPQPFIDDLLERVDIVEVIDRRIKLKRSGRNYSALCPFHDEKTPSFSVNGEKQFYYCFGCGASGNAIGFVMDFDRVDFPQAVENLANLSGVNVPREESPHGRATSHHEEHARRDLHQVLEAAARFYREQLRQHPQAKRAIDYLKNRGVSGEIAKRFGIGYAPPGWDNLLQTLGTDNGQRQLLLDGGLLVKREEDGRTYDRFRDRIIFPIHDNRGRVIAFGGRVLTDEKPKYLNSPETSVFHKGRELYGLYEARKAQRQLDRLIVVEGYMDVVALAQFGIPYAVATLGTATSTEHLTKAFRLCPEIIFCFDGDRAGRQAAQRALEAALPAMEDGRQIRFLFLPEGEDPDSLVRAQGSAALERLFTTAQPLEEYLLNSAAEGLDVTTMEGRARQAHQAAPLIERLPQGVFRELMLEALATRTGINPQRLSELMKPASAGQQQPLSRPAAGTPAAPHPMRRRPLPPRASIHQRNPTLHAVGLLVLWPRDALRALSDQPLDHLTGPEADLLKELLALLRQRPESSTAMLMGFLHQPPWRELMQRAIDGDSVRILNEHGEASAEAELSDTLDLLQNRRATQRLEELIDKLRNANYAGLTAEEKQQLHQLITKAQGK